MKDNNYITILGWMVNKLKLSGNELMVYALIHGFSQDGKSGYEGGGKYLRASCGISPRTLTGILNSLLKKKYVLKEYFIKNNVKYGRYKINPDFISEEDKNEQKRELNKEESPEGDMAKTAVGYGKNCHRGMAKIAIGYSKNCHRGMAKIANNITTDINLDTTTTAEQPDLLAEPPPCGNTAAADFLSPEVIKKAITGIDRSLLLKADFYDRAAAFLSLNYLDRGYFAWIYKQSELRNPNSFEGMFFTLFFAENMVEKYKILKLPEKPPPAPDIKCPVCGALHDKQDEKCPACSLPKDASSEQIDLYRKLFCLTPEKRDEYLRKETVIYSSCKFDFQKLKEMKNALNMEFGIEVSRETPSRSCHP